MKLIAEIRRRKVFRAFMVYVAVAWFLLGVFDLAFETWDIPERTLRYVWIAVLAGFPIAMTLVWRYDITDDGIVRTPPSSPGERVDLGLRASDYVIFVVFLAVLCAIGYQLATSIMGAGVDPQAEAKTRHAPPKSIAVLPFEDISPEGDQAYLANGIADELRLELQHLHGLRVAGRTSSNAYALEDGKTPGATLNVESILEGSVRKEGDSVRITVQLTNLSDGFTIWSESYNRKLEKIFEMQEQIATSVAGSLGVRLGVGGVNAFHGAGTQNVEAYEAYLQARSKGWHSPDWEEAIRLLERAVELDPNYAVAWSMLAYRKMHGTYLVPLDQIPAVIEEARPLAVRGVQLDPESAASQSILALVRMTQRDWVGSEQGHRRAIELLADRPMVDRYAVMLLKVGRADDAQKQFDFARELEPLGGRPANLEWHASLIQGRIAETRDMIDRWADRFNTIENTLDTAFNEQDPETLKAAIRALPEIAEPYLRLPYIHLYAPLLEVFDSPEQVMSLLQSVYRDESLQWARKLHDIALVAAYFGEPEFALKIKGEEIRVNSARLHAIWYPVFSEARQLPGFKDLAVELNMVEYWHTYGWADNCAPLGDNDFTCH